jgi:hypothetical protein
VRRQSPLAENADGEAKAVGRFLVSAHLEGLPRVVDSMTALLARYCFPCKAELRIT